jgi:curved DNA-binding protein CbpA
LFRGRCANFDHLENTIELFNDRRADIEAALASGGITGKTHEKQTDYVAKFYEIVNDPKQRKKYIEDRCRGQR